MNKKQTITVCAFLHHEGKLLIAKRSETKEFLPGKYELVGGHVEFGEDLEDALKREVQEELQIDIKIENPFDAFTYLRDKEQTQVIEVDYFATLLSSKEQIKLDSEVHSEYRWITEEEIEKFMPKGDRETEAVKKGFKLLNQSVAKKAQEQIKELEDKCKRALADYQNLQHRVNKEKEDWIKLSNKEMLLRLLPVLDTFMLASQHTKDQGLQVSISMFLDTLKAEGVTKIKTEGEKFNPEIMECIQTEDGTEGKVLAEIRPGYLMHDKLLRPAQVKVGKEK